jgi:hypothetical protein
MPLPGPRGGVNRGAAITAVLCSQPALQGLRVNPKCIGNEAVFMSGNRHFCV